MVTCPRCNGEKEILAQFVRMSNGTCRSQMLPCNQCRGQGKVTEEMLDWIRKGKEIRAERLLRNVGLREEAIARGIFPSELSAMEQGRIKPQ